MIDFRKHLPSEVQARLAHHDREVAKFRAMSSAEFVERLEYYFNQCERPRWPAGTPVYDAVMYHVIVPEMIRRFKGGLVPAGGSTGSLGEKTLAGRRINPEEALKELGPEETWDAAETAYLAAQERPYEPEPALCYVDGNWAYFTTAPLMDQWGDDWDDAPYQFNAGPPYGWASYRPVPRYRVVRLLWAAPGLQPPSELSGPGYAESYSVKEINGSKELPWLASEDGAVRIMPGCPVSEFRRLVAEARGISGEPEPWDEPEEGP